MYRVNDRTSVLDLKMPDVTPPGLGDLVPLDLFDRDDWGDCFSLHQESIGWDAPGPGPRGIVNRKQYRADCLPMATPVPEYKLPEFPKPTPIDWEKVRAHRAQLWQQIEREKDQEAIRKYLIPIWLEQGDPVPVIRARVYAIFPGEVGTEILRANDLI